MKTTDLTKIRRVVAIFIILLILSGVTAFPLVTEADWMTAHINSFPTFFHQWIINVSYAVHQTPTIVLYGTDWLAFAHIIIAIFFVGVYIDPVKNKFNITVGIIACIAVFLLAFICGPIRGIPFYHQLIDCSFGAIGLIPLVYVRTKIKSIEEMKGTEETEGIVEIKKNNTKFTHENYFKQPKFIPDYLIKLHLKTSSWVAGIIGPMVFDIGSKDKNWNLCTAQLLQYPEGSLGKTLGEFLKKHQVELLAGAEYHDIHHVLFDYSISFKDEVALQFFLHGNGNKSIASISTRIGAWCLLPTAWKYLKASYERGKKCKDVSVLNFKTMLHQDLTQIKTALFA